MTGIFKSTILMTLFFLATHAHCQEALKPAHDWKLPLDTKSRKDLASIRWGTNGDFLSRRNRHLHTGIDFVNLGSHEKVYAAASGKVVSVYAREPNKSVMVEHRLPSGEIVWTVYVHVTDVKVKRGESVTSDTVIAHLMSKVQLNIYGWHFNHLHFEVLKKPRITKDGKYLSYSTWCKTEDEVERRFHNPVAFFIELWALEKQKSQ